MGVGKNGKEKEDERKQKAISEEINKKESRSGRKMTRRKGG
jgi:hypothetical protein